MSMILPELWSKNSGVVRKATFSILEKYMHLMEWKNNESILEFGFADGKNSVDLLGKFLPENYKEFIGTDISQEMVTYAKEKYGKIPRYDFMQLNIAGDEVPIELTNRFDHIFGFSVIHIVKNTRQAFKNIHKMLKPGGVMFITVYERSPSDEAFVQLSKHPKWSKYAQEDMISNYYYSSSPHDEYMRDIKTAFKDCSTNTIVSHMCFENNKEFDAIFRAVNAILPRIPKNQTDDYLKDYLEAAKNSKYINVVHKNGETCFKTDSTLFVFIAKKENF